MLNFGCVYVNGLSFRGYAKNRRKSPEAAAVVGSRDLDSEFRLVDVVVVTKDAQKTPAILMFFVGMSELFFFRNPSYLIYIYI